MAKKTKTGSGRTSKGGAGVRGSTASGLGAMNDIISKRSTRIKKTLKKKRKK